MIDAHTHHNGLETWPEGVKYMIASNGQDLRDELATKMGSVDGLDIASLTTNDVGGSLVNLNTNMYHQKMHGVVDEKVDIPSLVIVSTMDMEFAYKNGFFKNRNKYPPLNVKQPWNGKDGQIENTEKAVESYPLRLFPLYSYDPRRYSKINTYTKNGKDYFMPDNSNVAWKEPFTHIVGYNEDTAFGVKNVWVGFSINPQLGFKPLDGRCTCLRKFYKECESYNIPVLAHCAPDGVIAKDAEMYINDDGKNSNNPERLLNRYVSRGEHEITDNNGLNYFYQNYVHPDNWLPVLDQYPQLRLCLAHFGGNSVWQKDDDPLAREWIKSIVELTHKYQNVYTDISGLNIYDEKVIRPALRTLLEMIQHGHKKYAHLKYKLIFGSDWYYSSLTDGAMNYGKYCEDFKLLFDDVDDTGNLWDHVSLFNPWTFYLGPNKKSTNTNYTIDKLYATLKTDNNVNRNILEGTKHALGELIGYINKNLTPYEFNGDSKKDMSRYFFVQYEFEQFTEIIKKNLLLEKELECIVFVHRGLQHLLSINNISQSKFAMFTIGNMMGDVEALGYTSTKQNITIDINYGKDRNSCAYRTNTLSKNVIDYINTHGGTNDTDNNDRYYVFAVSIVSGNHSAILIAKANGDNVVFNVFDQNYSFVNTWYTSRSFNQNSFRKNPDSELQKLLVWYNDDVIDKALLRCVSRLYKKYGHDPTVTLYPLYKKVVLY